MSFLKFIQTVIARKEYFKLILEEIEQVFIGKYNEKPNFVKPTTKIKF